MLHFYLGFTYSNPNLIFYYPHFKHEITLSHEIVHLAAKHEARNPPKNVAEQEADYFAARLNGISLIRLKTYAVMGEISISLNYRLLSAEGIDREINRLRARNVPEDIVASITRIMEIRGLFNKTQPFYISSDQISLTL